MEQPNDSRNASDALPEGQSNVEQSADQSVQQTQEDQKSPETGAEGQQTPTTDQQEPVVPQDEELDVDGIKVKKSELKQILQDRENDANWRTRNQLESEQLNRQREELAQWELLKPVIEKNPQVLQQLFNPQPSRNIQAELQQHYAKMPTDPFDPTLAQWNLDRIKLEAEYTREQALTDIKRETERSIASDHNERIEKAAIAKYRQMGFTEADFKAAAQWIGNNVRANNGKYPDECFDMYFATKHPDRMVRQAKLDTARNISESIRKAKPATPTTDNNRKMPQLSQTDEEDNEFLSRVQERKGH